MKNNLLITGYKSSGKTFFGRLLSERIKAKFIDSDWLIEKMYHEKYCKRQSCRQISLEKGEGWFRGLEKQVVRSLLGVQNSVISLGGGALLTSENHPVLRQLGVIVYLKVSKEVLKKRMLQNNIPSFLDSRDPEGSFENMYQSRQSTYETESDHILEVEGKSNQAVLEELANLGPTFLREKNFIGF